MLSIKIETVQMYLHANGISRVTERKDGIGTPEDGNGRGTEVRTTTVILEVYNKENVVKMQL